MVLQDKLLVLLLKNAMRNKVEILVETFEQGIRDWQVRALLGSGQ